MVFRSGIFALRWERRIREYGTVYTYTYIGLEGTVRRYLAGYKKTDCTRRVYFIGAFGVLVGGILILSSTSSTRAFIFIFLTWITMF